MRNVLVLLLAGLLPPAVHAELETTRVTAKVLDANGQAVAGAVVFADAIAGKTFKPPAQHFIMKTINQDFAPLLLAVPAGATVEFPNTDEVHHHLYSFSKAKKFNRPLYKEKEAEPVTFDTPGVVKIGCNIHDWMQGVVFVTPTPYYAMTDEQGVAQIEVPRGGSLAFLVFHGRLQGKPEKTLQSVSVDKSSAKAEWRVKLKGGRKKTKKKKVYY